jgi:hypothetical protein
MAADSIWLNPNSAFYLNNVSIVVFPTKNLLITEIAAWEKDRNKNHTKTNWQFTTDDARIKLKRLYPSF